MPHRRMTLSKFIIEDQRRSATPQPDLTSLLNDVQTACKLIGIAAGRGRLHPLEATGTDATGINATGTNATGTNADGDEQKPLDIVAKPERESIIMVAFQRRSCGDSDKR